MTRYNKNNLLLITRTLLAPPTGPTTARGHTKVLSTSIVKVRQTDQVNTATYSYTGLTSVTFPPLIFSHYDLMPAMAILRNNGHTAKLSTKPAT